MSTEAEAIALAMKAKQESSLNNEEKVEVPATEVKANDAKAEQAVIEDNVINEDPISKYLAEKKSPFKSYSEIENFAKEYDLTKAERDSLKEELEKAKKTPKDDFVDDDVRRINELKKAGTKFDKEYFELMNKDFDAIHKENPINSILEAMRLKDENKGLTNKALLYKIKTQYQLDKWANVDESEMTADEKEEMDVAKELFERDAFMALESLKKVQSEKTVFRKPTAEELQKIEQDRNLSIKKWGETVDRIHKETTKFTIPYKVEDKDEVFEFEISDSDRKEVSDDLKSQYGLLRPFMKQDEKGNTVYDDKAIYEMRLQNKLFKTILSKGIEDGIAIGKKTEFEKLKNTNFNANEQRGQGKSAPKTEAEAIKMAAEKQASK